jgi:Lrp/AsnC family leucine-responsive transcriptional regulator
VVRTQELRLDRKDVEILSLLREDARAPLKDIASKIALSIPAVKARVERMRELGIIKGFTVVIDPSKIAERVRVYIMCKIPVERLKAVRDELSAQQEVRELHVVAGSYNLVFKAEFRDLGSLTDFLHERLVGALEVEVLTISKTDKEEYGGTVMHDDVIRLKCDFCHAPIVTRPVIKIINGGRYYFSSEECADAFERRLKGDVGEAQLRVQGTVKPSQRRKSRR